MARVAGSSVSKRIAGLNQRWMRCYVHDSNNMIKSAMDNCTTDTVLVKIAADFMSVKRKSRIQSGMDGTALYLLDFVSFKMSTYDLEATFESLNVTQR